MTVGGGGALSRGVFNLCMCKYGPIWLQDFYILCDVVKY